MKIPRNLPVVKLNVALLRLFYPSMEKQIESFFVALRQSPIGFQYWNRIFDSIFRVKPSILKWTKILMITMQVDILFKRQSLALLNTKGQVIGNLDSK